MNNPFVEYEGKVISRSESGNYYEVTRWNRLPNGKINAVEKRLLDKVELKKILKNIEFHAK